MRLFFGHNVFEEGFCMNFFMVVLKAMKIRRTRLVSFQRFGKSLKTRGYWGVCSVNLSSFKSFESFLICFFFFCFFYFLGLTNEIALSSNPYETSMRTMLPNFKSGVLFSTKKAKTYLLPTYYPN